LNRGGEFQTKPDLDLTPDHRPYKSILDAPLAAGKVVIKESENSRGLMQVFAYTPLNNGRWILCFQQESEDAFAALASSRNLALVLYLASALAALIVAFILARRMTSRITDAMMEKEKMTDQVVEAGRWPPSASWPRVSPMK
jgi:hypothetical protein